MKAAAILIVSVMIASLSFADDGYKVKRANDGILFQNSRAVERMNQVVNNTANHARTCDELREISIRILDYYENADYRGREVIESTRTSIREFCAEVRR